jgi:hypothetical protein
MPAPTARSSPPKSPRVSGRPLNGSRARSLHWRVSSVWWSVSSVRAASSREFCDVDVLRQLRRRSLAALRKEVEPVEQEAFARFLTSLARAFPPKRRGIEALVETLGVLSGAALVASTIETRRAPCPGSRSFRLSMLDELCTAGEVVWVGAGGLGARDGRVRLCFADQLPLLAPGWEQREPVEGPLHDAIRSTAGRAGGELLGSDPQRRSRCVRPGTARLLCGISCGPARSPTIRSPHSEPCSAVPR